MSAKIISKPVMPVEPVFMVKGHGWLTAGQIVERFYNREKYSWCGFLPDWLPDEIVNHPLILEAMDDHAARLEAEAKQRARQIAKEKWDRNKAETARRFRKMR